MEGAGLICSCLSAGLLRICLVLVVGGGGGGMAMSQYRTHDKGVSMSVS